MPMTVFWHRFLEAMTRASAGLRSPHDLLVPAEDLACETNWPAYGNPSAAFMRGTAEVWGDGQTLNGYLDSVVEAARTNPAERLLVVNMNPHFSLALLLRHIDNIVVASFNLAEYERALNPRSLSIPGLPILTGSTPALGTRNILASFQGVASHPIRHTLAAIADGRKIIVNLVDGHNYVGKINALTKTTDSQYEELLADSVFAFVPRGDASCAGYRLLEVMSFGCIPVILSDGGILPFDRQLDWNAFSLCFSADAIPMIPDILASLSDEEVARLSSEVQRVYATHFKDLDCIANTLVSELNIL